MPKHLFKKGQSGNPAGKPKGANQPMTELRKAMKKVAKDHDCTPLENFVEQSYKDNAVLIALMRKILPDKKIENLTVGGQDNGPIQIIMFEGNAADTE